MTLNLCHGRYSMSHDVIAVFLSVASSNNVPILQRNIATCTIYVIDLNKIFVSDTAVEILANLRLYL